MVSRDFSKKRAKLLKDLKAAKELTPELEKEIFDLYGPRGKRAIAAVKSDSVRKEEGRWFVRGNDTEYEVVRTYCTCYDYVLNVVTGKAGVDMCYHALAKTIRELLDYNR